MKPRFLEAEARERAAECPMPRRTQVVSEALAEGDIQAVQVFLGRNSSRRSAKIGAGREFQNWS